MLCCFSHHGMSVICIRTIIIANSFRFLLLPKILMSVSGKFYLMLHVATLITRAVLRLVWPFGGIVLVSVTYIL